MLSDEVVEDDGSGEVSHIMGLGNGEISVPAKGIPVTIVFHLQNMMEQM